MDREYGRFQLVNDDEKETSLFYLENVSREDDFWLKLANEQKPSAFPIGFIKFKKIGQNMFVIAEVRPGHGPILDQPAS